MSRFYVSYFGRFSIHDENGKVVQIRSRKALALLLAVTRIGVVERTYLAELLWGSSPNDQRRASLRQALSEIRNAFKPHQVLRNVGKYSVEVAPGVISTDIKLFEERRGVDSTLFSSSSVTEFLLGLDGLDAEFDDWLYQTRRELRAEMVGLIEGLLGENTNDSGINRDQHLCEALMRLDPYSDLAVKRLIELNIQKGNTAHAAQIFLAHKKLLEEDLQVQPQFNMSDFISSVGTRALGTPALAKKDASSVWYRKDVVNSISKLFHKISILDGEIVFILGPSGVGKTFTAEYFIQDHVPVELRVVRTSGNDYAGGTASAFLTAVERSFPYEQSAPMQTARAHNTHAFSRFNEDSTKNEFRDNSSITGSEFLDELILRSVEGQPIVFFFDDIHKMSAAQRAALKSVLSVCKMSYCMVILAGQRDPGGILDDRYDRFRLLALNDSQIREFIEASPVELGNFEDASKIGAMSLGLPFLIQRAADYLKFSTGSKEFPSEVSASAEIVESVDWSPIDQVVLSLSTEDKTVLASTTLIGGKVSFERYEELFGFSPEVITRSPLDLRLIDEYDFVSNSVVRLSHDIVAARCRATLPLERILQDKMLDKATSLFRGEISAICDFISRSDILSRAHFPYDAVVLRLIELDMWSEIVSLVERYRGHCDLSSWVEEAYLHSLFETQRFVSFAREFLPVEEEMGFSLRNSYSKACAYIGSSSGLDVPLSFAASFYRGDFKQVISDSKFEDGFEALGYRAMALAQLGEFSDARKEVSGLLRIASETNAERDRYLAEFFRQYVLTHQGDLSGAVLNLRQSLLALNGREGEFVHSLLQIHLGFVLVLLDRPEAGLKTLESLYDALPVGEAGVLSGYAETALSSALIGCGLYEEAARMSLRSLQTAKFYKLRSVEVWALRNIFRSHRDGSELSSLEEAITLARKLKMAPDLLHLIKLKGDYEICINNYEVGESLILEAERGYRILGMSGSFFKDSARNDLSA